MTDWLRCAMVSHVSQQGNLIGSAEAAELLGWSKATVKRKAKLGDLPVAMQMPGATGAYLFERSAIESIAATEREAVAS